MKKILLSVLTITAFSFGIKAQIIEDFENTPLTGWAFYQSEVDDPGFTQTGNQAHGGSSSFYHDDANIAAASESWMVTPSFNCSANTMLEFWYRQNWTQDYYAYSGVWISTASNDPITNPTDFVELNEFDSAGGYSEDVWSRYSLDLSAYNGQTIYIALKYIGDFNHEFYVDDLSLFDFFPQTRYVNQNATGNNNGTSWTDAFTNLNVALDSAMNGDSVWVAAGAYYPDRDRNGDVTPIDNRSKSFSVNKDLFIYGGFNASETSINQRDLISNPTILSGDIGVMGDETDNCYTVFGVENATFVLNGFTVSDGYANGLGSDPEEEKTGAGIFIYVAGAAVSSTISNCIIKNNTARGEAGLALHLNDVSSVHNILVENTRFTENLARWAAPFSMLSFSGILIPTFVNCLIDNNTTDSFNGEIGNTAPGGRFYSGTTIGAEIFGKIINCTFTKNSELTSAVLIENRYVLGISGPNNNTEIHNTIFYGNNVNPTQTSIGYGSNSTFIPNSLMVYNTISEDTINNLSYATSVNNTQVNPLFTNSIANDFTLQNNSPAINLGDTTNISSIIPIVDLANASRFNGAIDIGCYEYQGTVGVNEIINQNNISLYPNPTSNTLTFQLGSVQLIERVTIFDVTGKTIKTVVPNNNTIDVFDLIKGIYFIQIQTENGMLNSKFIKE